MCIFIYTYRERERESKMERERKREREINLVLRIGSCNCGSSQIQNLQTKVAGWRPRKELLFESKGHLLVEFSLHWRRSVFFSYSLQVI